MSKDKCMWCDEPATRYCDAVIGISPVGCVRDGSGRIEMLLAGLESEQWTCDAPMCDEHAFQIGWISGTEPDSIDRCPHHAEDEGPDLPRLIMFQDEAERARRAVYASVRRARLGRASAKGRPE